MQTSDHFAAVCNGPANAQLTIGHVSWLFPEKPALDNSTVKTASGIAVYIDLENVSWLKAHEVRALADELQKVYGAVVWVKIFGNRNLLKKYLQKLSEYDQEFICACSGRQSVDIELTNRVETELHSLPQNVAIVSGDTDFKVVVIKIACSGRKPVVVASDNNLSQSLWETVQKVGGHVCKLKRPRSPQELLELRLMTAWEHRSRAIGQKARAYAQKQLQNKRTRLGKSFSTYCQNGPGTTIVIRSVPNRFNPGSCNSSDRQVAEQPQPAFLCRG